MVGSGLKKMAQENGMKVAKGVAYGSLRGYAATMSEGSGYKQIVITTKFADTVKLNELQAQINSRNITREFRVRNLTFAANGISIVFHDTVGTMKKIRAFLDWFIPLLDMSSATKADICTECGMQATTGCWKLIDGVAFYMHESCAQRAVSSIAAEEQARRDADEGSYIQGFIGALCGSILGAAVWAVVLYMGYVASLVGLLIGWLAEKGYSLMHGKQGKAKILILVVVIVFGVALGTIAADAITVAELISEGDTYLTYADIPSFLFTLLMEDSEYSGAVMANMLQGLLFAAIGVFALLQKTNEVVSGTKVVDLE